MKKITTVLCSLLMLAAVHAQKKSDNADYNEMKADIEDRTFKSKDAAFETDKLPDEFKNESSVILAQKRILEAGTSKRMMLYSKIISTTTLDLFRAKVFINDQVSLQEYSEIPFTKLQSKTGSYYGRNKNYTFINNT